MYKYTVCGKFITKKNEGFEVINPISITSDKSTPDYIANNTSDQYYLDGSLKVEGSIISKNFLNEAGEPIGLPKNVDVKDTLDIEGSIISKNFLK